MKIIQGFQVAKSVLSRQAPRKLAGGDDRERAVREIVNDVATRGDAAVLEYTQKFDGVAPATWEVSKEQISTAYQQVDEVLLSALKMAAERIHTFLFLNTWNPL